MAMKKTHDICVAVGKYTDRNGAEKKRWLNVGRVMTGDDGGKMRIIERHFNPAGVPVDKYDGIVLAEFEVKQKDGHSQGDVAPANPIDDSIPF